MKFIILVVILTFFSNFSNGYEILGVLPFETKSHYAIGKAMMLSLAEFSHNVSVISPYSIEKQLHFYQDFSISSEETSHDDLEKGK